MNNTNEDQINEANDNNHSNNETDKTIEQYLTSLFNSLQEELITTFSTKEKEKLYYIYTRLQKQQKCLELFVRLNRNSEVNKTKTHLYFIITIDHNYPVKPPYVVFASDLLFPSLNDQRNLLQCLHPEWKVTSKVSTIINNMHSFLQGYNNDINNNLFIFYGQYLPQPHLYSINDFLINNNNKIKKVMVILDINNSIFEDYYIIITDISIILFSIETHDRSKGKIAFMSELRMVDGILKINLDKDNLITDKSLEDKIGFQFLWKEEAYTCDYGFIIDKTEFQEFKDDIMNKNSMLMNKFCLFMNNERNTIETLQKIIQIKETFLEKKGYDWFTFNSLMNLYQSIIELCSNENLDLVGNYVIKLQVLLKKYNKDPSSSVDLNQKGSNSK